MSRTYQRVDSIEIPFCMWTDWAQKNCVLDGGSEPQISSLRFLPIKKHWDSVLCTQQRDHSTITKQFSSNKVPPRGGETAAEKLQKHHLGGVKALSSKMHTSKLDYYRSYSTNSNKILHNKRPTSTLCQWSQYASSKSKVAASRYCK